MSGSNHLAGLSDQVGTLEPTTPEQNAAALRYTLRVAGSRDEAARLADMLGIASALDVAWGGATG